MMIYLRQYLIQCKLCFAMFCGEFHGDPKIRIKGIFLKKAEDIADCYIFHTLCELTALIFKRNK